MRPGDARERQGRWTVIVGGWLPIMATFTIPLSVGAETRGYVISMIHTATYANSDTCAQGGNGGPLEFRTRRLVGLGYSEEKALQIIDNGGRDDDGNRVEVSTLFGSTSAPGQQWYGQPVSPGNIPTLMADPQVETAQGRFAYGFDLDGRVGPDSFEHPVTGESGVDNQMWRVLGCFDVYHIRRPVVPYNESIVWDTAIDSMPAWLISVSGADLDRDGDVTVTFDRSLNVLLRDAHGGVLSGATFVLDLDPRSHNVFAGTIKDRILTIEPGDFYMQGESQFYAVLRFAQAQLRLTMESEGSLTGFIGGYQPWSDYYHYLAIRGENDGQVDLPGVYYAMKRLADGVPDPATGENTAISAAYWLEAVPAFHTTVSGELVGTAVGPGPEFSGPAANRLEASR
ncbi:MAG: hypothetical protein VYE68_06480 [Acidobacteriota bacterium]|nr:hypothetical protein [Acidobacteriota bacterium]